MLLCSISFTNRWSSPCAKAFCTAALHWRQVLKDVDAFCDQKIILNQKIHHNNGGPRLDGPQTRKQAYVLLPFLKQIPASAPYGKSCTVQNKRMVKNA